jgi:hypothetical protein
MSRQPIFGFLAVVAGASLAGCASAPESLVSEERPEVVGSSASALAAQPTDDAASALLSTVVQVMPGVQATAPQRLAQPTQVTGLDVQLRGCSAIPTQVEVTPPSGAPVALVPNGSVFQTVDGDPITVAELTVYYKASVAEACALVVRRSDSGTPEPPAAASSLLMLARFDIPPASPAKSAFIGVVQPQTVTRLRVRALGCSAAVTAVDVLGSSGPSTPVSLARVAGDEWAAPGLGAFPVAAVAAAFASSTRTQCAASFENASPGAPALPGEPVLQVLLGVVPGALETRFLAVQNPVLASELSVDLRDCPGAFPTGVDVAGAGVQRRFSSAGPGRFVSPNGQAASVSLADVFLTSSVRGTCKLSLFRTR